MTIIQKNPKIQTKAKQPFILKLKKNHTFLQVVPIILSNGVLSIEKRLLLDYGSDSTLLKKDITKRLILECS